MGVCFDLVLIDRYTNTEMENKGPPTLTALKLSVYIPPPVKQHNKQIKYSPLFVPF